MTSVLASGYVVVPLGYEGELTRLNCIVTAAESGEEYGYYVLTVRAHEQAHYGCHDRLLKLEQSLSDLDCYKQDAFTILRENGILFFPRTRSKKSSKKRP